MIGARNADRYDELDLQAERERFELFRGERVPVSPTGYDHGALVIAFGGVLAHEARKASLGRMVTEVGFWLDADTLLAPDIALVAAEAVPVGDARRRMIRGVPRLAIEIASPGQESGELVEKIDLYLAAGVDLVWALYPGRRLVAVSAPQQPTRILRAGDILDGGGVIPGFAMTVADIYDLVDLV